MSSKPFDVLVIGELNVDLILNQIDSFPEIGKEKLAGKMDTILGSSSAIFASNISSLGARVAFLGKVGEDTYGDIVLRSLQRRKVDTSLIIRSTEFATGVTVVLNYGEDRAMITYPGAMEHLNTDEISDETLVKAQHMHFSSYFLQPGLKTGIGPLFQRAKKLGLTTSLDPQWDPQEKWDFNYAEILPYVDIFLPNLREFLNITGENSLESAIEKVKNSANSLIIKNGNEGSVVWSGGHLTRQRPFLNDRVVDAIGAGDSFNAGFIIKYIHNNSIEDCQQFGNLMGAISTTAAGGTGAFEDYGKVMAIANNRFHYTE